MTTAAPNLLLEGFANDFATALSSGCGASDMTLHTDNPPPSFLQGCTFRMQLDAEIIIFATGNSTTDWVVLQRGAEGTTPTTHNANAQLRHWWFAGAANTMAQKKLFGPRALAIETLGGGLDDGPQLNSYLGTIANTEFALGSWAKTAAYMGSQKWNILTPVILNTKFISMLHDGSVFDVRNFLNNSVTMTLALTSGSTTATVVATSNPGWIPVQSTGVQVSAGLPSDTIIITGTGFTPGGAFDPVGQGQVGAQFQLSHPYTGVTGNVAATMIFNAALILTGSADAVDGAQSWGDATQTVEKLQIVGPCNQGGTTPMQNVIGNTAQWWAGIQMGAPNLTANAGPAHKALKNITVRGCFYGIQYSNNAYANSWEGCDIFDCVFGISLPFSPANYGESIKFTNSTIFGNGIDVLCSGVGVDARFIGGSMDYLTPGLTMPFGLNQCKVYVTKGRVFMNNVHCEDNWDGWYWFAINDPSCLIDMEQCDLQPASTKNNFEFAYSPQIPNGLSSGSVYYAGVFMTNCHVHGTVAYNLPTWIAGNGRSNVINMKFETGFIRASYGGGLDLNPYATGNGILSNAPYAASTRFNSLSDGSFGVWLQGLVITAVLGNNTVQVVGTPGYSAIKGANFTNPLGLNLFPAGTTVTSVSGTGGAGSTITMSNPANVGATSTTGFFDCTTQSASAALAQWNTGNSTGAGDLPVIDAVNRSTTSDGLQLNSMLLQVGTNGHTCDATFYVPVSAGQIFNMSFMLKATGLTANTNTLFHYITFLDRLGNPVNKGTFLSNTSKTWSADLAAFTLQKQQPFWVPPGVATITIDFKAFQWNTTTQAWISGLVISLDGQGQQPQAPQGNVFGDLTGPAIAPTVNTVKNGLTPLTAGQVATSDLLQATVDATMPWNQVVIPLLDAGNADDKVGTWTTFASSSSLLNGWLFNSTAAQNDKIGWYFNMAKGTWEVSFLFVGNTDAGIVTILLDGAAVGATVDTYRAAVTYNQTTAISIGAVAATGKHLISLKMASKNASASAYKLNLVMMRMRRTA